MDLPSRPTGPSGRRGQHGRSSPPGRRISLPAAAGASPPNALFAEMLRAARELLAVRSPLDAELMVSELLGTWWGHQPGRSGPQRRRRAIDVEELIGQGLIAYAAQQATPASLALLSGIACLGTPHQAASAEQAALAMMEQGIARPGWAEHVGAVVAAECYLNRDAYGDRDEVVCVFSYAGQEQHALVVVVEYNSAGMACDGWVTSQVSKLLDRGGQGSSRFEQIPPPMARRLLEAALAVTERAEEPPVSDSFPSYHAFIRARVRTLPPSLPATSAQPGAAAQPGLPGAAGRLSGTIPPRTARRQSWRPDRRAALVAEFLASDEAEDVSDREAASRCADHIVDYGCDQDFGRPLRMSPAKVEKFLLDWLPRKVMLTAAEQHAMPHVLAAWVRWAGAREGRDGGQVSVTLDKVFDSVGTFMRVYHDPVSFGLEPALVARLLPDSDLEALPRRVFAFGVLQGSYQGTDLGALDPAQPADRRMLLAADHDTPVGRAGGAEHIDHHLELADRLWRGDPPELWEAAQRLLDLGEDRHAVLHTLMGTIRGAGPSEQDIAAALNDLPPDDTPA